MSKKLSVRLAAKVDRTAEKLDLAVRLKNYPKQLPYIETLVFDKLLRFHEEDHNVRYSSFGIDSETRCFFNNFNFDLLEFPVIIFKSGESEGLPYLIESKRYDLSNYFLLGDPLLFYPSFVSHSQNPKITKIKIGYSKIKYPDNWEFWHITR